MLPCVLEIFVLKKRCVVSFDETVMYCGAPALCGIKPSCLFSIRRSLCEKEKIREWSRLFKRDGRYIITLPKQNGRMLVFIYDKCLLEKQCTSCCVKKISCRKKVSCGIRILCSTLGASSQACRRGDVSPRSRNLSGVSA